MLRNTKEWSGRLIALGLAASLAACGGGGSSGTTAATTNASGGPLTVTAEVIATPAATGSTPADASTAGTLPTLAFVSALTSSTQNVAITGSGTTSVMTFTSPAFTLTGATGNSPVWGGAAQGGMTKANGNVVVECNSGYQATSSGSATTDLAFQTGANIFLSANMVPVTNAAELQGLTFNFFDCSGANGTTEVYNANGTTTHTDNSANTTLTAAQAAQFVSTSGITLGGGSNFKVRIYKTTVSGQTRYFSTWLINQVSPNGTYVRLGYQV